MRDRFGIFGAVIRIRKLSLLLVVTLRMPNTSSTRGRPSCTWARPSCTWGRLPVSATLGEEPPANPLTGMASSLRAENHALGEGFPKSRADTRGKINAVGGRSTLFSSYLKKILLRVQHSGKRPSSLSAGSPGTHGSHSENLFFMFLLFLVNNKSTVIHHKLHLYITNDQICRKSNIY